MIQHTVRPGRGAAVGVVSECVDVKATLSIGVVASDIPADLGRRRLGLLLEGDGPGDLRVTSKNADCNKE